MEKKLTIFDFNPTKKELDELGFDSYMTKMFLHCRGPVTKDKYISLVSEDKSYFDIALLHEMRGLDASSFWAKTPEMHQQYEWGFDYDCEPEQ